MKYYQPPQLQVFMPDGWKRQVILELPNQTIGRSPDNDLVLDHLSVALHHARLIVAADQVFIEDLGSEQGIWLGGQRIPPNQPIPLGSEHPLFIGQVQLRISPKPKLSAKLQSKPLIIAFFSAIAVLMVILGGITLIILGMFRNKEKPVTFTCDQQPMRILSKGGDIYYTEGLQVLGQLEEGSSEPILGTQIMPTLMPLPTLISVTEITKTSTVSPILIITPSSLVHTRTAQSVIQSTPSTRFPIVSLAFLELPFPYQGCEEVFGGTDEQFRRVSQSTSSGGRINSWFDHYFPLYDSEPEGKKIRDNLLIFYGSLVRDGSYDYSGHPGYDYSTCEYRKATTPVFAAADGVVADVGVYTGYGDHTCGSPALYIKINHNVQGVGNFQTYYLHLNDDEYYQGMKSYVGKFIIAGTRIGTMGNTGAPGCSSGHHLHFSVLFDCNNDGIFDRNERIDPYGFSPSVDYSVDPWYQSTKTESHYLWVHPLGVVAQISETGGGLLGPLGGDAGTGGVEIEDRDNSMCAESGSLPPGGRVYWAWSPGPLPNDMLYPTSQGCTLSVLDRMGNTVSYFNPPLKIALPFSEADLVNLDEGTLAIYWLEPGSEYWKPLETQIDRINKVAIAYTDKPGHCALLAQPTQDIVAPETRIEVTGRTDGDGIWYDQVTVSMSSEDPSGIDTIEYSLDGGSTWQPYSEPFILVANEMSAPLGVGADTDERIGGYLVLTVARDGGGNVEDPPAQRRIYIVDSQPPTPMFTPTITPTPTSTEVGCSPILTVLQDAHCRKGPSQIYDPVAIMEPGMQAVIDGYSMSGLYKWWWILIPNTSDHCWISDATVSVEGDTTCLPIIQAPSTPEPKDIIPPEIPALISPIGPVSTYDFGGVCPDTQELTWSEVADPSGVERYEIEIDVCHEKNITRNSENTTISIDPEDCTCNFQWRVRAVDQTGNASDYSDWVEFYYTYQP